MFLQPVDERSGELLIHRALLSNQDQPSGTTTKKQFNSYLINYLYRAKSTAFSSVYTINLVLRRHKQLITILNLQTTPTTVYSY